MKTQRKFKLALVGTDSLRGKEIKNVLAKRKWASFDIEFYDADVQEEYSKLTQFRTEPKVIHGPKAEALDGKDLIFLAADKETNRTFGGWAAKHKVPAIDLSETFNLDQNVLFLSPASTTIS